MKRLRKKYAPKKIRFYQCGEYGENTDRPHYHACLFNHDFNDKIKYSEKAGVPLYISEELTKLWPLGFSTVGAVTFDSAAYVARYILKKINGEKAEEHYKSLDRYTGEICEVIPEYTTMSRRPGIAAEWYKKFKVDVYPDDFVVMNGKAMNAPRYYDSLYEVDNPEKYEEMKSKRKKNADKHKDNNTPERLATREKVAKAKLNQKTRGI